jgi:hypothetical protein
MWCGTCYKRHYKYGDTTPVLPGGVIPQSSGLGLCSHEDGCARGAVVRSNRLDPPKAQLQACREQLIDSGLCACRLAGPTPARCASATVEGSAAVIQTVTELSCRGFLASGRPANPGKARLARFTAVGIASRWPTRAGQRCCRKSLPGRWDRAWESWCVELVSETCY